jgi:hypothetical protein
MFHFTHGDAKHIASLLNDPALQTLGVTLVQEQASLIDRTFAFRSRQQQQLLSQMLQLINQYASAVQLQVFLQAAGTLGFRVIRGGVSQGSNPAPRAGGSQPQAVNQQQRFGMVE